VQYKTKTPVFHSSPL